MEWVRGEIIGRGSFGTVNLATFTKSDTNKSSVVKSSHISDSSSLKNEKEILTKLGNRHPNIIQYLGDSISEENGKQLYNLFLEYASKGSLADILRKSAERKMEVFEVKRCTQGILKGLQHVHENGFVHCDVKLENILVFEDFHVKVADFGLAGKVMNGSINKYVKGTPLYVAPEIVAGNCLNSSPADIWAVGCAVVEMVTGKPAWECGPGNDVNGLFYRIGVRGECPRIPEKLCEEGKDFLSKCFLKDPNERWTARMLLDHPFLYEDLNEKSTVSPKCPFEFLDWECWSFGSSSSSIKSFDSASSYYEESEFDVSCFESISRRFERELVSDRVVDWSDLSNWIIIR